MAQTTKKTTAGKNASSSGGKRVASSGASAPQKKKSTPAKAAPAKTQPPKTAGKSKAAPAQPPRPIRREVWALVCASLGVFTLLGCFGVSAIFIDFFCGLLKGLLGYGFWTVPVFFGVATYILALHRGRPVRLRLACAFLMPFLISALIHSLLAQPVVWDMALWKSLWASGKEMASGGALSGMVAQGFVSLFSNLGAVIILAMTAIVVGLAAFNRTLLDVSDWIFNRPHYEYPVEPERPRRVRERTEYVEEEKPIHSTQTRRALYDIPVEDGPLVGTKPPAKEKESREKGLFPEKKKGSFFNRTARVPAPDELLTGKDPQTPTPVQEVEKPKTGEIPPVVETSPVQATPAVDQPIVPPIQPVTEKKGDKVTRQEAQQAAQEVAQDIQRSLEEQEEIPYQYPPLSLLQEGDSGVDGDALAELRANQDRLASTLESFDIDANILNVTRGPSVTRYELELDQGVRLSKLTKLADDIALSLGAKSVRIAPIPDQISMVGIEVPNRAVTAVKIHSVIGSRAFTDSSSKVSFAVGKDIANNPIVGNIAKMPHMLIAGTTGSGKSVCTNSLIISLLYKATPDEVRLIMVDPKMVELGIYNGIPHLLIPVVTDPKKAAGALQWAVSEMMKRYQAFSEIGVRDLASYNAKAAKTEGMDKMPQVVVIIDELADLMLVAAKEVEEAICRVAQMGRASGMHLIVATQRPSADVITGLMKANIPSRIAFAVASGMESRIILDTVGAERLVGKGDMLYAPLGAGKPTRVQGCLITDQEVASVVEFIKSTGKAQYDTTVMEEIEQHAAEKEKGSKGVGGSAPEDTGGDYDELIDAATEVVVETGMASVSMLQRRLKLGYARAARLVDQLEEKGIVGPFEGSKPRQVMITKDQWQELKYRQGTVLASAPAPSAVAPTTPLEEPAPVPPEPAGYEEDSLDRVEREMLEEQRTSQGLRTDMDRLDQEEL